MRAVYDLSATPFFLRGSGYEEGTLFPWVVSDFSLMDAIESGIVKLPRVPVTDNLVQPIRSFTASCGSISAREPAENRRWRWQAQPLRPAPHAEDRAERALQPL